MWQVNPNKELEISNPQEHKVYITVNDETICVTSNEVRIQVVNPRCDVEDIGDAHLNFIFTSEGLITDYVAAGEVAKTAAQMYDDIITDVVQDLPQS